MEGIGSPIRPALDHRSLGLLHIDETIEGEIIVI